MQRPRELGPHGGYIWRLPVPPNICYAGSVREAIKAEWRPNRINAEGQFIGTCYWRVTTTKDWGYKPNQLTSQQAAGNANPVRHSILQVNNSGKRNEQSPLIGQKFKILYLSYFLTTNYTPLSTKGAACCRPYFKENDMRKFLLTMWVIIKEWWTEAIKEEDGRCY